MYFNRVVNRVMCARLSMDSREICFLEFFRKTISQAFEVAAKMDFYLGFLGSGTSILSSRVETLRSQGPLIGSP